MADRKHSMPEEPGAGTAPEAEEKARRAHAVISRLLTLSGAMPFPGPATGAPQPQPQQQYRFSYYYPSAGAWPAGSWPTPASRWPEPTAVAGGPPGTPPLTTPFVFPGGFH